MHNFSLCQYDKKGKGKIKQKNGANRKLRVDEQNSNAL